ncbi:MAG: hypothetical protein ABIA63_03185 [bacterium]
MHTLFQNVIIIHLIIHALIFGKIFFHADFECGETFLESKVKPGQKTIKLVLNHRLQEWPLDGGEGVIEYNLPSKADTFHYKKRKGSILKGVSGIRYGHVSGTNIQSANLYEWYLNKYDLNMHGGGKVSIKKKNPLFGSYSAIAGASTKERWFMHKELHSPPEKLFFRFYQGVSPKKYRKMFEK